MFSDEFADGDHAGKSDWRICFFTGPYRAGIAEEIRFQNLSVKRAFCGFLMEDCSAAVFLGRAYVSFSTLFFAKYVV